MTSFDQDPIVDPSAPNVLPADLAPALHILEPAPAWLTPLLWMIAAAVAAYVLRRWWLNRPRPAPTATRNVASALPAPSASSALVEKIDALREKSYEDYRRACHDLARLLREDLGKTSRRDFTTATAGEIARALGESAFSRLFLLLADLQFGRREPDRDDFQGMCDLARETAANTGKVS